jgi:Major Facilitator Superfamily/Putative zinc-finger
VTRTETNVAAPRTLTRRLMPLQVGVGVQGLMLWVPVEKLFQTQIGFDAASIGVMAAAYAAVVPLLEVPSGILADRRSRNGVLVVASAALAASSLLGGLSTNVVTYVVAAMILGVYFAMSSGTVDSVVYDTVLEETGASDAYEKWIGRVRIVESAAFAGSALAGGVLAGLTSPRLTYFLTVPLALASIVAFSRFDEPRLHRSAEPVALRRHVATTFGAMTRLSQVRRVMLLAALAALLSQAVFEFGPLWLVSLDAPAALFGPYWAALVATLGLGGYLTSKLRLGRTGPVLALSVLLAATPVLLATSGSVVAVIVAQTALALLLAIIGIHAGLLLHDAVPSTIRAGVSSGVGTLSWVLFLPFSLVFGWLARGQGVERAAWVLVGIGVLLAVLLAASTRVRRSATVETAPEPDVRPGRADPPADLACRELVFLVTDYLDGVLPADWRAGVERHLAECDGCTAYLQQIRVTIDALQRLGTDVRPPHVAQAADAQINDSGHGQGAGAPRTHPA